MPFLDIIGPLRSWRFAYEYSIGGGRAVYFFHSLEICDFEDGVKGIHSPFFASATDILDGIGGD
jgi:hypothetical protein